MSACYVGGEKIPLRVGGCTQQLRQQRAGQYICCVMPSSNWGWQNGWFYLQNDGGLLPAYTGKVVTESPQKWVWGAPTEEQKRLAPLLRGSRSCATPKSPWPRWRRCSTRGVCSRWHSGERSCSR